MDVALRIAHLIKMAYIGWYWIILGRILDGSGWYAIELNGVALYSLLFVGIYWYSLVFIGIHWYSLVFVSIC